MFECKETLSNALPVNAIENDLETMKMTEKSSDQTKSDQTKVENLDSAVPFVDVARIGDLEIGKGKSFEVAGRLVALFFDGTHYSAIDDLCPHMGASLGDGCFVEGVVSCPWHAWRFRVADGSWCDNPKLKIETFDVRVDGDRIAVRIPPTTPPTVPEVHVETGIDQK